MAMTPQQLMEIQRRQQELQRKRQQLASQQPNQNVLNEGQSLGQLFTDPTDPQRAAMMQAGLSLLSSNTGQGNLASNVGHALQGGLQTLAGARQAQHQSKLAGVDAQLEAQKEKFGQAKDILAQARAEQREQRLAGAGEGEVWQDPRTGSAHRFIEDTGGQLHIGSVDGPVVDPSRMGLIKKSGQTINVDARAPKPSSFEKELGKQRAQAFAKRQEEGQLAASEASDLNRMADLNERMWTGTGAAALGDIQRAATSALRAVGAEVPEAIAEGAADADTMRKMTMDRMFTRIRDTKGAISEKEMAAFEKASAGIRNTREGNRMIINTGLAAAQRKQQRAAFDQAWLDTHGDMNGAGAAWNKFTNEVPATSGSANGFAPLEATQGAWQPYVQGGSATWQANDGATITPQDLQETAENRGTTAGAVLQDLINRGIIQ